ncbi:hypothetical protein IT417_00855 [bacterium]|nr:hypothetical protein [bacterium]
MRKKVDNKKIIESMVMEGGQVRQEFRQGLEQELLQKLDSKPAYINLFLLNMSSLIKVLGLALLFGVAGIFTYNYLYPQGKVVQISSYDQVVAQMPVNPNADASMSKIAVDEHNSISTAALALSFTPLKPIKVFGGELASVQTSKSFDGSKSDSMYLTFVKNGDIFFRLSEMKQDVADFYVPEEGTKVPLTFGGDSVDGYIVKYDKNDIDPISEQALYGEVLPASTSIVLHHDGLFIEVTHFGGLTDGELKELVESFGR